MKLKIYIGLLLLFAVNSLHAQVGIGTTSPNTSSMLDITSTNSGLLIPRIALLNASDLTTITAPITSLLVYNSGFSPNGFYYWNGSLWVQLGLANSGWSLTGNSGTSTVINFFGTTDNKDIVFKRNNLRAGYIGDPAYDASYNFNNGNTSFGGNSMLNPTINFSPQQGVRNTAFGVNVMPNLSTGILNTGIGEFALFSLSTGIGNTSLGSGSLYSNSTANFNVAVGRNTLTSSNGSNNTGVGFASLRQNLVGTNNTALGFQSGYTATGSNNIFLGNNAGYNETGNSKLYIEYAPLTTDSSQNNALIYGDYGSTPKVVRANGQLQVGNPSVSGYSLPIIRGTSGQVLQTDGVGGTLWATANNTLSVIRTNLNTNQSLGTAGWQKITFNSVVFDLNSEFVTGTNRFVAAKTGYYEINACYHTDNQSNMQFYSIGVYKNNVLYQQTSSNHINNGPVSRNINCIVSLTAGDYIEIFAENYQTGVNVDSFAGKTFFEVRQIR